MVILQWISGGLESLCTKCVVMAAWSRKMLKILWEIFAFFGKTTPYSKFFKFCSQSFHRDTYRRVVFIFREIWPTWNRWNRALLRALSLSDKNRISPGSPAVATAPSRQISARASTSDNVLRLLQISSKSVHFRQSCSRTREHRPHAP